MNREKHFIVDILFVLALFGVFAVSALALVTIGADVYRHTVQDMSTNYETRTAVSYLTEKIRQNDTAAGSSGSSISMTTLSDKPALMLMQDIEGEIYCTYLYCHDGYLRELFIKQNASLGGDQLNAGQKIMELSELNFSRLGNRLLAVQITTPEGETHHLYLSTHCTE